jgi:tRNA-splicing ligase RtcB (3'-phosphate/5'-hydroxy nucleic acid ligase)
MGYKDQDRMIKFEKNFNVVSEGLRIPIMMWLDEIEEGALEQAKVLANLPFAYHHVALMPDCHFGYGMPIGAVLAADGVVVPNAVGVDIGCGMNSVRTNILAKEMDYETVKRIIGLARKVIPVGMSSHQKKQDIKLVPELSKHMQKSGNLSMLTSKIIEDSLFQLGTLGSGNHFVELQKGTDGYVYIMIHSGSRGLGKVVGDHYDNLAKELNCKNNPEVKEDNRMAFLPIDTDLGKSYINDMKFCVEWALASRRLMMTNMQDCIKQVIAHTTFEPMINIAHNYAELENHFGKDVWIHRKGATLAREGTLGIIPGSQGTYSYIVIGKGNKDSFETCSHGAGRQMGRKRAISQLDLVAEQKRMEGIVHSIRSAKELDEAPSAYKDVEKVMENQKDLVSIKMKLTPLGVLKG